MREVPVEEARRIAVRAQAFDGRADGILETVRRLGFLQLDPISAVAPPQHLVLWSRLGDRYDPAELDRLLWEERKLVEWDAYLYPIEDLPILKARMRRRDGTWERRLDAADDTVAFQDREDVVAVLALRLRHVHLEAVEEVPQLVRAGAVVDQLVER